jgi:hypothetical protein
MSVFTNCCEENNQKSSQPNGKIRKEKINIRHNNAQNQPNAFEKKLCA